MSDFSTPHQPAPNSFEDILARLKTSAFRAKFKLSKPMQAYACQKGLQLLGEHADKFISERLAPAHIPNDGKQTPMKGHPVFLAQHACACCCRGCLNKWHDIPAGRALTEEEKTFVISLLLAWVKQQAGPTLLNISQEIPDAPKPAKKKTTSRPQPPEQPSLF